MDVRNLLRTFPGRDLGEARRHLGIVLDQDQATGSIKLAKPALLEDIVELLGLEQAMLPETALPGKGIAQ
jgi:hypothetical protein